MDIIIITYYPWPGLQTPSESNLILESLQPRHEHSACFAFNCSTPPSPIHNNIIIILYIINYYPFIFIYYLYIILCISLVSWLILSEIFPSAIKGRAIACISAANWAVNTLISFTFLSYVGEYKIHESTQECLSYTHRQPSPLHSRKSYGGMDVEGCYYVNRITSYQTIQHKQ